LLSENNAAGGDISYVPDIYNRTCWPWNWYYYINNRMLIITWHQCNQIQLSENNANVCLILSFFARTFRSTTKWWYQVNCYLHPFWKNMILKYLRLIHEKHCYMGSFANCNEDLS
jgi:hypothetical protein